MMFHPAIATNVAAIGGGAASGDHTHADATTYINAVTGAGGTINAAGQTAYHNLIYALDTTYGLWSTISRMWAFNAQDSVALIRDLKGRNQYTATGSPTHTAKAKIDFNGSTQYLNTGIAPNALSGSSVGVTWDVLDSVSANDTADWGAGETTDGTFYFLAVTRDASGNLVARMNGESGNAPVTVANPTSSVGLFTASRTSSSQVIIAKDGSVLTTATSGLDDVPTVNILIGAFNFAGTPLAFSSRAQACWVLHSGWNATQIGNFATAWGAFKSAMSAS